MKKPLHSESTSDILDLEEGSISHAAGTTATSTAAGGAAGGGGATAATSLTPASSLAVAGAAARANSGSAAIAASGGSGPVVLSTSPAAAAATRAPSGDTTQFATHNCNPAGTLSASSMAVASTGTVAETVTEGSTSRHNNSISAMRIETDV